MMGFIRTVWMVGLETGVKPLSVSEALRDSLMIRTKHTNPRVDRVLIQHQKAPD